ncbi:DUF3999 family protein [Massilia glaciei]|uniref:DUF3999 domain-containing protein n=1 Tax=Massilia glaciei TaxID=1524097 RepID=A0A2U2H957_9BURK|nr:DUF3999 family protein [Massilia glaciei]PWF39122.1 DUF3999 domain-containing protein [Massilia glaciei]
MKRSYATLASALCWLPAALAAAPGDTPADYTHSIPLTVSGKNAVVQLRLPQAVYLNARTAGLSDLRVFDARSASMPIALLRPPPQSHTSRRDIAVKIFPVMGAGARGGDVVGDLDIRTAPDGSLTSVSTRVRSGGNAGTEKLTALVLDLREGNDGGRAALIDALKLSPPPSTRSYTARVALEVSDDLKRWDTVGYSDLSWLVNSGSDTLSNDRISFTPRAFRYARLTWPQGQPLQFERIIAESPAQTELAQPVEQLTLQAKPGRVPGDLVYASAVAIPVERLGLQFGDQNIVMPATLGRYAEVPAPTGIQKMEWQFRPLLRATFFQINQGGQRRTSGDITVDQVHAANWVLRSPAAADVKPQLRVSWTPSTLVLLAGGTGPYALAFGRADAKSALRDLAQVAPGFSASEVYAVEQALAGPLKLNIGNNTATEATSGAFLAGSSARTRMWALWGALLLGVAVLGFMAWRLVRQMKDEQK